jgi:hypothetical protein
LPVLRVPASPEPEPEKTAAVFLVPTRVEDQFGRPEEFVRCEDIEAATHWDARVWRELP